MVFLSILVRQSRLMAQMVESWSNIDRAVIFDRDGTLNEDNGYTHKASDLKWKPGAMDLIKSI